MFRHAMTMARQFRVLVAAIFVALILPRIAQPGMFLDGVTYAVLARNLAIGIGTFWAPSFSTTVYPVFYEQPPLGIALQSLAFVLLGDHLHVERLYSVLVFGLTAVLVARLWREHLQSDYDWLPLLFWIVPSTVTWGAINNMLEATQALVTTGVVLLLVYATRSPSMLRAAALAAVAGIGVVAAFLVKGPVGLFPVAVPPLTLLLLGTDRRTVLRVGVVWITLLLCCASSVALLLALPEAKHALSEFATTHLAPALSGERGLPRRSFDVARHFTLGILARMVALAAVLWLIRPRGRAMQPVAFHVALFFLAVGFLASLPLLVSPVLAGHYFIPSVPYFALAVATVTLPAVKVYREPSSALRGLIPITVAGLLIVASVVVLAVRGPLERRNAVLIESLNAIAPALPNGATIGTCASAADDWGLHGYFQRFFRVSLDARGRVNDGWFVVKAGACEAPAGCTKQADGPEITLFRCERSLTGRTEAHRSRR